jgi:hypothetical protein
MDLSKGPMGTSQRGKPGGTQSLRQERPGRHKLDQEFSLQGTVLLAELPGRSEMRKFDPGGIRIDGPDDYESTVESLLKDTIAKNPVGLVLLRFMDENPKYLYIVPFTKKDAAEVGECNARTLRDNEADAHPKGVFRFTDNGKRRTKAQQCA